MALGQHRKELIRFGIVGVGNTLIDFGVFWLLTHVFGLWLLVANTLGFAAAVLNSYILNKYWTFGHTGRPAFKEFRNFLIVVLIGLAISNITVYAFAEALGVYPAKGLSIIVTMIWNYFGSKRVLGKKEGA
jgi:putative flippase GtrA